MRPGTWCPRTRTARDLYVASVLVSTLDSLKMEYPEPPPGLDKIRID
jgi:hypothetical protein